MSVRISCPEHSKHSSIELTGAGNSQEFTDYVRLEKSKLPIDPAVTRTADSSSEEMVFVTVRVRRRSDSKPLPDMASWSSREINKREHITAEAFEELYGADPVDLEQVVRFAEHQGLEVQQISLPRRSVFLTGTVSQMNAAFLVNLETHLYAKEIYRSYDGFVHIPSSLQSIVQGVFGLDNRRMARRCAHKGNPGNLTPVDIAKYYCFPKKSDCSDQTIGIIEFGGGYKASDIADYFVALKSKESACAEPTVASVEIDGMSNSPDLTSSSAEVTLDICVAGAIANRARIAVYFTPFTEQGWVDVLTAAIHDPSLLPHGWHLASVISISWAWTELRSGGSFAWSQAAIDAISETFQEAAVRGVTILASSGDDGTNCQMGDGLAHCYYPASDPWITSCGGTTIEKTGRSSWKELTWNDNGVTGGGISDFFDPPPWQVQKNVPASENPGKRIGRGIPDIAGYANGYQIVLGGAQSRPQWGTSGTAPLYAGLIALTNSMLKRNIGYLNPILYALDGDSVHDIDDGASNAVAPAPGYIAGPGWDACTGLGSLRGTAFLDEVRDDKRYS